MRSAIFFSKLCFFPREARTVQISPKSLKMTQLVSSQHCEVDCSEKSAEKAILGELLRKNNKRNSPGSKITDFCKGNI